MAVHDSLSGLYWVHCVGTWIGEGLSGQKCQQIHYTIKYVVEHKFFYATECTPGGGKSVFTVDIH